MSATEQRIAELSANLEQVRGAIVQATVDVGRDPSSITLVAITKNRPVADVLALAALGVTDFGENRDQEARAKHEQCGELAVTWHFVGQLQRNKAASVARYADIVESVDREALVEALARGAQRAGRSVGVALQVDLGNDPAAGRAGVAPQAVLALADTLARWPQLSLRGLMAVAPLGVDPRGPFDRLYELARQLQGEHPAATMISAGMSSDMAAAIAAGATHVRIGTALLGPRRAAELT